MRHVFKPETLRKLRFEIDPNEIEPQPLRMAQACGVTELQVMDHTNSNSGKCVVICTGLWDGWESKDMPGEKFWFVLRSNFPDIDKPPEPEFDPIDNPIGWEEKLRQKQNELWKKKMGG